MNEENLTQSHRGTEQERLKPCPFCGNPDVSEESAVIGVVCHKCMTIGPGSRRKTDSEKLWNQRPAPWIAVADELPDADLTVLVANNEWDGNPVGMGWLDGEQWRDIEAYPLGGKFAPTHWMPLPEPPLRASVSPCEKTESEVAE